MKFEYFLREKYSGNMFACRREYAVRFFIVKEVLVVVKEANE